MFQKIRERLKGTTVTLPRLCEQDSYPPYPAYIAVVPKTVLKQEEVLHKCWLQVQATVAWNLPAFGGWVQASTDVGKLFFHSWTTGGEAGCADRKSVV